MVGAPRKRRAVAGGTALIAVTVAAAVSIAAAGGDGIERESPARSATGIVGLRATLADAETPLAAGGVAWTTRWRLCWRPVPGAISYLITTVSSEGVDPIPREIRTPCYALTIASGTAPGPGQRPGAREQAGLMEVMLSVSVAARFAGGSTGQPSPDVAVGVAYP